MDQIEEPETPVLVPFGDERTQLESFLDFFRTSLLHKCAGLTIEQLKTRAVAPSTLTLLGLLRHMALVEQVWFDVRFAGHDVNTYFSSPEDPDADFNDLDGAPLDEVYSTYVAACSRSRELAKGHDLGELVKNGREVDLRWIHLHLIEEYARHCGHADFLRELIDGVTDRPPGD